MALTLPGLDPMEIGTDSPVHSAQRFLASAYDSVSSLIEVSYPALRAQRTGGRGRLTHAEQDLFRAAVVFAGAGVDAVLKQALRSCVPIQIERSDGAREKYLEFAVQYVQEGKEISARRIAKLLIQPSSESALREEYVKSLTGSSLQSQMQVTGALAALGIKDQKLFKAAKDLNPLFKARNEIAHEMDMTPAAIERTRGARTRRERVMSTYVSICHTGLNYCQVVLNRLEQEVSGKVEG